MGVTGLSHTSPFSLVPNKGKHRHSSAVSNASSSFSSIFPCSSSVNCVPSFVSRIVDHRGFLVTTEQHGIETRRSCLGSKKEDNRLFVRATANTKKLETEKDMKSDAKDEKSDRRAADWKKAVTLKENGSLHRGRVDACNNGGLLVRFGSLQGFLPFSQMSLSRLPQDGSKTMAEAGKELIGETLAVKVIEVSEEDRRLIFSEKQAVWMLSVEQMQAGNIFKGRVNRVTDFGAFVDLCFPDGSYPVSGLVHVSELSWDPVRNPRDVIQEGEDVQVKVIEMDLERMRLALSIKQLQADPLFETLETLMPQEETMDTDIPQEEEETSGEPLPGLEDICQEFLQEEGITGVTLGRQALEKRVVSQDLELWLSSGFWNYSFVTRL